MHDAVLRPPSCLTFFDCSRLGCGRLHLPLSPRSKVGGKNCTTAKIRERSAGAQKFEMPISDQAAETAGLASQAHLHPR